MHAELDSLDALLGTLRESTTPGGGPVLSQDNTRKESPYRPGPGAQQYSDPDSLFGDSLSYHLYKKEKPEHRLMLWLRLQGHNIKETAALTGYTPQTVSQVCKQPWFREAFCKLASEMGKDAVQTYLEGEVLPALQRTVELANSSSSDAVKLAANREVLDRFLGKSTVKVETKHSGSIDSVVYDAQKLMDENARIEEQLRARGIGGAN